jgi:Ca2+-binding EF-hand superfamily protein
MLDTIYTYTAKRDKAKLMDAFKVFDTEGTGRVSYKTFEEEILVKIGEPMDEKEVADTLRNLNESGAVEGDEIQYEVFVTWIMDELNK